MKNGQKEVNKKKKPSILTMALFLALLDQPNYSGFNWKQYIEATMQYNTQQLYKQVILNIQQQKSLEIDSSEFQTIINRQNNQKLNINNDKISGAVDLQMIGLNNLAKVEGIKKVTEDNSKVRFIAVEDDKTTLMCDSLNNQEFYINKENVFDRYYGENQKELRLQRIKCNGLVLGLNLPPIQHHFHYCRSSITYLIPNEHIELEQDKKYDLFDNVYINKIRKYNINKLQVKHIDKKALYGILNNMEKVYKDFPQVKNKIKQIKEVNIPAKAGINIEPKTDGTYIMEININAFKDKNIAKKMYENDVKTNYHPQKSSYKDMGIHEAGHMALNEILKKKYINQNALATDWNNNITAQRIVNEAFENLKINDIMKKRKALKEISTHAAKYNSNEAIAEAFVDYYTNKNNARALSKEIVNVMKGMI